MGKIVVVGLGELRQLFGGCDGRLCNVFKIPNVRRSLWNGTMATATALSLQFIMYLRFFMYLIIY